jgi:hypothetical protein
MRPSDGCEANQALSFPITARFFPDGENVDDKPSAVGHGVDPSAVH